MEPELLEKFPQLRDPKIYGSFYGLIEAIGGEELQMAIRSNRRRRKEFDVKDMRDLLARIVRDSGAHLWSIGSDGGENAADLGRSPDSSA